MPTITIDGNRVEAEAGCTILEAAGKAGVGIPALCKHSEMPALTSCMVCQVRLLPSGRLTPACATRVEEGMAVDSDSDEVHRARRVAIEMLLADHTGDCEAPCQAACAAHMNIPLMTRQIAAGRLDEAAKTVYSDIPLAAILGRICPAPCEGACRRKEHDGAVSICLLKRHVADWNLAQPKPYLPAPKATTGKRVAVVGAGPAGLSAACYLALDGHRCELFDENELPGGKLRYSIPRDILPLDVVEAECSLIFGLGIVFNGLKRLGRDISLESLAGSFDAVVLAIGDTSAETAASLGLKASQHGIKTARHSSMTDLPNVFAAGACAWHYRIAVQSLADGRRAAQAIDRHFREQEHETTPRTFSVHMGRLQEGEMELFLADAGRQGRNEPPESHAGLSDKQAVEEARRCLHCDCRRADDCKLRIHAHSCHAGRGHFKLKRKPFQRQVARLAEEGRELTVILEPGKCISCGVCVGIAEQTGQRDGLTFLGRGYDVRVSPPPGRTLQQALQGVARRSVEGCPTGALAFRD
ncbi:MAG: (2Fe-2S)-binding protein [Planctomycetes bacterium]|nr:(2Fe-2S)-binding protein [Planctomycetota bacterium]